jgi:hypothetical protein
VLQLHAMCQGSQWGLAVSLPPTCEFCVHVFNPQCPTISAAHIVHPLPTCRTAPPQLLTFWPFSVAWYPVPCRTGRRLSSEQRCPFHAAWHTHTPVAVCSPQCPLKEQSAAVVHEDDLPLARVDRVDAVETADIRMIDTTVQEHRPALHPVPRCWCVHIIPACSTLLYREVPVTCTWCSTYDVPHFTWGVGLHVQVEHGSYWWRRRSGCGRDTTP